MGCSLGLKFTEFTRDLLNTVSYTMRENIYISIGFSIFCFKGRTFRQVYRVKSQRELMNSLACKTFFTCPTAHLGVNTLPLAKATGTSQIFHLMVKCCCHMLTMSGKRFSTEKTSPSPSTTV